MSLSIVPPTALPDQQDIPPAIREQSASLKARVDRINRVLGCNSAPPATLARAKDELIGLANEALNLWGQL